METKLLNEPVFPIENKKTDFSLGFRWGKGLNIDLKKHFVTQHSSLFPVHQEHEEHTENSGNRFSDGLSAE